MGLELEVDSDFAVKRITAVNKLQSIFGDFLHYENDGSLRCGRFNIKPQFYCKGVFKR